MNCSIFDYDRSKRLRLLWELMSLYPGKRVKSLQREALKYYPLGTDKLTRQWLSYKTVFAAIDQFDPLVKQHKKQMKENDKFGFYGAMLVLKYKYSL